MGTDYSVKLQATTMDREVIKMSTAPTLKDLFSTLQDHMIADAKFSGVLSHPTDKGDNSEENWIEWFDKYLPKRYRAAKATIIDSREDISDQIDLVLYDAQYSYLAFNQNGILYLPAESVYAVFEVKQDLTKEHMEYAGKKIASVRRLHRTSASIPYAAGVYPPKRLHRILSGILTTESGWAEPFNTAFKNCLSSFPDDQQIDCGCVLQAGSFYYDYAEKKLRTSTPNESLVFFFLQLLVLLQEMGTVPAIDLNEYMKALTVSEELNG